jgi:hypothetical protein
VPVGPGNHMPHKRGSKHPFIKAEFIIGILP